MKKRALLLSLFLTFSIVSAQEIIENPEKPLSEKAGRVLELKEELRITDDGSKFYFAMPRFLKISKNGCIYIVDEDQFLKFSPEGKFITNLYTKGKGPGEIDGRFYYVFEENDVYILDPINQKILQIDENGLFGEDIKLNVRYNDLLGIYNGNFILLKRSSLRWEGPGEIVEETYTFVLVNKEGEVEREYPLLGRRVFIYERGISFIDPFFEAFGADGKTIYINNSDRYKVSVLDLDSGKIIRTFSRNYEKVKRDLQGRVSLAVQKGGPKKEYYNDIGKMFPFKKSIWIWTSTKNNKDQRLYDVYDLNGRFIDSFYFDTSKIISAVYEDSIFVREEDSDGFISLVKYKILDQYQSP
ncbi:MAG: hypothetical protein MUP98_11630 [Candidatus Aminicenantes bacterium]|nr:hypothetical protein [Candidatus Aminicenantes bacterium]